LKIIGVKEIPHWGKKSLECESMHVMHYEKEVMYACNMCMHTHRQNSTLNNGSHHSNKPWHVLHVVGWEIWMKWVTSLLLQQPFCEVAVGEDGFANWVHWLFS